MRTKLTMPVLAIGGESHSGRRKPWSCGTSRQTCAKVLYQARDTG
jgi:hypothetical protein